MANPIETARHYMSDVVARIFGISAWREAMQQPRRWPDDSYQYSWSIPINHALDTAAPAYAACEFLAPVTSRFFVSALKNSEKWNKPGWILDPPLRLATDVALIVATVYLNRNPLEFVAMRLAANAAVHVGLDLASASGKGAARLFRHFRPSGTILAV